MYSGVLELASPQVDETNSQERRKKKKNTRKRSSIVRQMIITNATILLDLCAYLQLEAHAQPLLRSHEPCMHGRMRATVHRRTLP